MHLRQHLPSPGSALGLAVAGRLLTAIDRRGYDPPSWTWGHPGPILVPQKAKPMAQSQDSIMTLDDLAAYIKLSKLSLYKLC